MTLVARYAQVFYKKAQDLTGSGIGVTPGNLAQTPTNPTATGPSQTLSPETMLQAKNTAIFLVKNTQPLGPLEWLEQYTIAQVKQAQASRTQNPLPIATPTAQDAAKNLKMAGRTLVVAMENPTFSLQSAKSALATINTQFKDFDNRYLKAWITNGQYSPPKPEGTQYKALNDALKVLGNLLK